MPETEHESWRIEFNLECQDEEEAGRIFNAFQDYLEEIKFTHWSAKMGRDLNMEKALKSFRDNKEEILSKLPKDIVAHYYPERDNLEEMKKLYPPEEYEWNNKSRAYVKIKERHLEVLPELEEE